MGKKGECERAIKDLAGKWAKLNGVRRGQAEMPSFSEFCSWVHSEGYGHYLQFRTTTGTDYDAEMWFDQELGQSWRN